MINTVLHAIILSICLASTAAMAGDVEPCSDDGLGDYKASVLTTIDAPTHEGVLASFTEFPSFTAERGVRIIDTGDRTLLRVVEFQDSVWYSAVEETRPGYFERDFSRSSYRRLVRETTLSRDTARLLESILRREMLNARGREDFMVGFDGTTYYFGVAGGCAEVVSPDPGTSASQLADVFNDLRIQASIPSRFLQLGWERRLHARLLMLEGKHMSTREYLLFAGVALAIIACAALPLLIAWVFAVFSPALPRRRWYVLVSAAVAYGAACIVALPFFVFGFFGTPLASQLGSDGHATAGIAIYWIGRAAIPVIVTTWLIAAIVVPIALRRRWHRISASAA